MSKESQEASSQDDASEPEKIGMLNAIIGDGYNQKEVRWVMLAAVLVAVNNGFVNGVCLSGLLSPENAIDDGFFLNKKSAMVSGVAGYVTSNATDLVDNDWPSYVYNLSMFLSYTFGSMIVTLIAPKAKPYAIAPGYSICWIIGGTMLLAASLLSVHDHPTRGIWSLAIAANGVSNGIASVYSANLIRCTLTGAMTDIGLIIGQGIRGKFDKVDRGIVLATIVVSFWCGGIISYRMVRTFRSWTLVFNAGLFYLTGLVNVLYLVYSLKLSFTDALTGSWDWTTVLNKITPSGDKESMLALFSELDDDDDGTLDMYELEKGLEGKVSAEEMKTLLIAADQDGDGQISKDEWKDLVEQLFIVDSD